mmetsp:Transcript_23796/g.68875  ORF Transcript_23796/g.68875 Transcript_23796/m.68875 type:complete len:387 (-) Transcript_23796:150-1310(-)|eukprot:CAMPEP_0170206468 /NCGR_PEP_ID=MMETSP0116_2-20130129/2795_1 /TAXON_ID=400756 /ORGANISM="Durinskia baltica, Strain CSIRO CS-38" /LENGTH=386 /DNA_ID=CAMNT_0010456893 /DNA_START=165 /DNA_END=1325 /DNA_ORIENTATION=+
MSDQDGVFGEDADGKWGKNGYGHGVSTVTGKFSKEESEKVRRAVKEYCAEKNISVARLCSECDHKAELKGAWMEIAKVLPERSVQSVYRHGLRQLHPFKRGLWTEEECETLEMLVSQMGKKWATIQDKLGRSADSCRDKYREMSDSFNRGRWKDNETELFKRIIREYLHAEPNADIKELGRMVEAKGIKISWSVISRKMVKRSRLSCFKKWQKITGTSATSEHYKNSGHVSSKKDDASTSNDEEDTPAVPPSPLPTVRPARTKVDQPGSRATHAAPTAGAAAAMAVSAAMNNPIRIATPTAEMDSYLLSELAAMDVARMSDVDWESIRVENAQERWMELLEEFQSDVADDSYVSLPLSSLAQFILDRKTSAQQAAETVEAVDLPTV